MLSKQLDLIATIVKHVLGPCFTNWDSLIVLFLLSILSENSSYFIDYNFPCSC